MKKVSVHGKLIFSLVSLLLYIFALLLTPITPYQVCLSWQRTYYTSVLFRYTQRMPAAAVGMNTIQGHSSAGNVSFISRDIQKTATGTYTVQEGRWSLSEETADPVDITLSVTCYVPLLYQVFEPHSDQTDEFPKYNLNHSFEYVAADTGSRLQLDRETDAIHTEIVKSSVWECKLFVSFVTFFTAVEMIFLIQLWRKIDLLLILMPCKLLYLLIGYSLPFYFFSLRLDIMALVLVLTLIGVKHLIIKRYKRK